MKQVNKKNLQMEMLQQAEYEQLIREANKPENNILSLKKYQGLGSSNP